MTNAIETAIANLATLGFRANLWEKNGISRLYVNSPIPKSKQSVYIEFDDVAAAHGAKLVGRFLNEAWNLQVFALVLAASSIDECRKFIAECKETRDESEYEEVLTVGEFIDEGKVKQYAA